MPIEIYDSDEEDLIFLTSRAHSSRDRSETLRAEQRATDAFFADQVIDLTGDDTELVNHNVIRPGELPLMSVPTQSGSAVQRDDFVEVISTKLGDYQVDFIFVLRIVRDKNGRARARGIPYVKAKRLKGKLPPRLNEVCMVHHIQSDSAGVKEGVPLVLDIDPTNIIKKRTLVTTNSEYPTHAVSTMAYGSSSTTGKRREQIAERCGNLVCRWKLTVYFTINGKKTKPLEEAIKRLHASEILEIKFWNPECALSYHWRGRQHKGGSWNSPRENRTLGPDGKRDRAVDQKYTLFDSFAGAGGVSRGAQSAGFRVIHAVDKAPEV